MERAAQFDAGHILVADPDESVFTMVRQLTAPDVWAIGYAETAEEVLDHLHRGWVSMVVVELSMLDGSPELVDELLDRSRRGVKVVVTTDAHSEAAERRARRMGPVYYAPKPVNIGVLSRVLQGALRAAV